MPESPKSEGPAMHLHGIVQMAALEENPPGSDNIELVLRIQGVSPGQPRTVVIPFAALVADASLDPDNVTGRAFQAEVEQAGDGRWLVVGIELGGRVLKPKD